MARKINLKGLHDTGDLIVTLTNGTVDASSQGFSAMFDNDPDLLTKFIGDEDGWIVTLNFNFTPSLKGKEFLIIIKCDVGTGISSSGIIISQGGKLLSKASTVNTAAVYNLPTKANSLGSGLVVNFISTSDVEIKEFYLKQNSFNPTKSSPPNLFINKLELRMKNYFSIFKNSTNFSTK